MALNFTIELQPGYLLMTYEGNYEPSLADGFTSEVVGACEKHQPSQLLVDYRKVEGLMATMDRYNLASVFAKKYLEGKLSGKIQNCRFALVGNLPLVDPKRFGETVANNRGINLKVFTDMAEALEWLGVKPTGE